MLTNRAHRNANPRFARNDLRIFSNVLHSKGNSTKVIASTRAIASIVRSYNVPAGTTLKFSLPNALIALARQRPIRPRPLKVELSNLNRMVT